MGPVFSRAIVTLPRRVRYFIHRAAYPAALFILVCTAWQVLAGTQLIRNTGDFARFGGMLFQILAPLQFALALFASALVAAASIASEKDRHTLDLLLLTDLSNAQFVLGKLFGSLLMVWLLLLGALPIFVLAMLFGGIELQQIGRTFLVTFATTLLAGSLGSTLALWREKTFQTLAMTATLLVVWLGAWELIAAGALGSQWLQVPVARWAVLFSPWQATLAATRPVTFASASSPDFTDEAILFVPVALVLAVALNVWGIARFRVWNPPQGVSYGRLGRQATVEGIGTGERTSSASARSRQVWANPVLWREVCTWAYGRKILIVRACYLVVCALVAVALFGVLRDAEPVNSLQVALAMLPLFVLSLIFVNAQAVTSITTERDNRALDLLLVTQITPPEFVFGKLFGVLYNTKEMVLAPLVLCVALWSWGQVSFENLCYLLGAALVLYSFVAMLGIHAGLTYGHSPTAIAVSLGTVFFLFIGIATCMRVMVAFSGSFQVHLHPFLEFMVGGGVGLFWALGARNPSTAMLVACLLCPFVTFYAITSFLLGQTLNVFLVTSIIYGFATAAMLVPALHELNIAARRPTAADD